MNNWSFYWSIPRDSNLIRYQDVSLFPLQATTMKEIENEISTGKRPQIKVFAGQVTDLNLVDRGIGELPDSICHLAELNALKLSQNYGA